MTFEEFIMQAREMNASDIHLTVGAPTVVRVNGELRKYTELSDQVVNRTILSILSAEQEKMLTEGKDIDFSFELKRLWNGGTGKGRIKLYGRDDDGKLFLVDDIRAEHVGCEYGERCK